jgi:hypothetical protein
VSYWEGGVSDTLRGEWRTPAVEDFLKQVYLIQQQVDPVPHPLPQI